MKANLRFSIFKRELLEQFEKDTLYDVALEFAKEDVFMLSPAFEVIFGDFSSDIYGEESSPKKCVNCSQLKMILSCRLLGHLFDDLFMIVVVGKHIEHTAACAPFIMLIDQD